MLVTFADGALGLNLVRARKEALVTVSMSVDFLDVAHMDDWLEARVEIRKMGRRLAFADCFLFVDERRILRASGVFVATGQPPPPSGQ